LFGEFHHGMWRSLMAVTLRRLQTNAQQFSSNRYSSGLVLFHTDGMAIIINNLDVIFLKMTE
jgi:hypothetical protein